MVRDARGLAQREALLLVKGGSLPSFGNERN